MSHCYQTYYKRGLHRAQSAGDKWYEEFAPCFNTWLKVEKMDWTCIQEGFKTTKELRKTLTNHESRITRPFLESPETFRANFWHDR